MPHRNPGWELPNGHIVRSATEEALCHYLDEIPHRHWALNFNVQIAPRHWLLYVPSIVLTEIKKDDRAVLIEPVNSIQPGGGVRRLQAFRRTHARDYFVVIVARRALQHRISEEAYDAIFPVEDFEPLGEFLRP
jgi:hypothetical protein